MSLSEYEKKRLENIRKNQEILASLNIPKLAPLQKNVVKTPTTAARKKKPVKVVKPEHVAERRSSKRLKQEPADLQGVSDPKVAEFLKGNENFSPYPEITGDLDLKNDLASDFASFDPPPERKVKFSSIDDWFGKMKIQKDSHVVKLTPSRIYSMAFHPNAEKPIVFAGDKYGNFGIWDVAKYDDLESEKGITQIKAHKESISCLAFNPENPLQLYSAAYDGVIRCLDMEKVVFREVLRVPKTLFSYLQIIQEEPNTLYFSNIFGELCQYDVRAPSTQMTSFLLHEKKMSSFSINPLNPNLLATSSNDRTLAFWDRRYLKPVESDILFQIEHKNAVTCAYFCPHDGSKLVTNCYDDRIRLYTDINTSLTAFTEKSFTEKAVIYHNNKTGQWITPFKALWGSSLFDGKEPYFMMGNMNKTLEVFSGIDGSLISVLDDEKLTAQPAVNAIHNFGQPWIASGTGSGRAYFWSPE